jgi:hypothetical protein
VRKFSDTYFGEDVGALPVNHDGSNVVLFDTLMGRALRHKRRQKFTAPPRT